MFKNAIKIFAGIAIIVVFSGCENIPFLSPSKKKVTAPRPPVGATVVAKVGDFYITAEDLDKEVEAYNSLVTQQGMPQNKIDSRDKKIVYLKDELVRRYMLYQEALSRGLDRNAEIVKALENTKMTLLVSKLVSDELERIEVSSKEIEDFYEQNKEALKEPEQRKISEIVSSSESEARQVYIELLKGTDFASLARQYSKGASASKGGDLGYIYIEQDPKKLIRPIEFYEAAFSPTLKAGGVSSIFKGDGNYYIVKVEEIKKSQTKPLSELRENIKSYILFEKQNKAIADLADRLTGELKIEIYEGKVD